MPARKCGGREDPWEPPCRPVGREQAKQAAPVASEKFPELQQQIYGADLKLVAKRPDAKADLIGVEISFGVSCGEDTMLLLYEWRDKKWWQVLRWQSGGYNAVNGAYGDFFEYVVIPHGGLGKWVVAVAHGMPWCTSRYSGFDLDAVETAHDSAPQNLLFHKHAGYDRGDDRGPVLKGRSDGFELRLRDFGIDFDGLYADGDLPLSIGRQRCEAHAARGYEWPGFCRRMDTVGLERGGGLDRHGES